MKFFRRALISVLTFCAGIVGSAEPLLAHAFWVVPIKGHTQPGERVVFDLRIGPDWPGVSIRRDTQTLISSFELDDGKQETPISGRDGARPVGHYTPDVSGANYAVMTSYPHISSLSGDKFEAYLAEEGLKDAQEVRRKFGIQSAPAKERYWRNVKTLILVGNSSAGFDRQLGLPLELIPLTDPLQYSSDQTFSVRLLRDGKALPDQQITASRRGSGTVLKMRTDAEGDVGFTLPEKGIWMIYAVDIEQSASLDADWESIWTSLTFEVK